MLYNIMITVPSAAQIAGNSGMKKGYGNLILNALIYTLILLFCYVMLDVPLKNTI